MRTPRREVTAVDPTVTAVRSGVTTCANTHTLTNADLARLSSFRTELYACLPQYGDELFEVCEAVLCTDGPVGNLVDLSLAPEHRRGHGGLYAGLNRGRVDVARLRRSLTAMPLPRSADGRLVLAVVVSPWLRPGAASCPDRSFCHTFGRGEGRHQMVPGWPYSFVAALETGPTSWTALLDAVRLEPGADVIAVTAAQLRAVIGSRVISAARSRLHSSPWRSSWAVSSLRAAASVLARCSACSSLSASSCVRAAAVMAAVSAARWASCALRTCPAGRRRSERPSAPRCRPARAGRSTRRPRRPAGRRGRPRGRAACGRRRPWRR
ncbi:transposase [Actinomadura sp. 21ATH]|uniref:transposase n=1 Tax=Actinomadura sp. 21ATH TaxID=1735444 RepID=UPI0035BEBF41